MPKKAGHPTAYTPEIGAEICLRITAGDSLRKIVKEKHIPTMSSVMRWLFDVVPDGDPRLHFRELYATARRAQAELYAEQIVDIADEVAVDSAAISKARVRIDVRKWISSKMLPKVYGDRLALEGGDPDRPIHIVDKSDLALAIANLLGATCRRQSKAKEPKPKA